MRRGDALRSAIALRWSLFHHLGAFVDTALPGTPRELREVVKRWCAPRKDVVWAQWTRLNRKARLSRHEVLIWPRAAGEQLPCTRLQCRKRPYFGLTPPN